jgi:putative ABC transport system substrate-binding protein
MDARPHVHHRSHRASGRRSPHIVPLVGEAHQVADIPRIGLLPLTSLSEPRNPRVLDAFRHGLRELGYVEGENIAIESRWAEGKYDRLRDLAGELVRLKVNIIVTYSVPAIQAAKEATGTSNPVATGFVTSLARPGGNLTGVSLMAPELVGEQLGNAPQVRHALETARALGIRLQSMEVRGPGEIDHAFAAITTERAGAVIVLAERTSRTSNSTSSV